MRLSIKPGDAAALLVVPVGLLVAYAGLRLCTSLFTELRELIFAKATEGAARSISLQVFRHLHALSLRFHLERQTGGMTRDIERGTRAVHSLISYSLYSIVPTLIEMAMVLTLLAWKFDALFAWITGAALVVYIAFTVTVTEWRTKFRRQMNELDSVAHTHAIDSLLNYETVKYFNNEDFEAKRYDESLEKLRRAALKSQSTLSLLNTGQQLVIAAALVAMLWRATQGRGRRPADAGRPGDGQRLHDPAVHPAELPGCAVPRDQAEPDRPGQDVPHARDASRGGRRAGRAGLQVGEGTVRFENVHFAYEPARPILHDLSFEIPAGKTVAVVGPSGAGKSTLARLLFRFYDVTGGCITIDGQDIRQVTQASLRQAIGIVPQDTVLFNDTVEYNIAYGRPGASREQVEAAAKAAHIHAFIAATPKGYDTMVGERGLEAVGRREAARGDRAHAAEKPADPDLRRSHLGARLGQRARHPGRAEERRAGQDRTGHRAPAEHGGRRARDHRARWRARRRAWAACAAARPQRALRRDVAAAAVGQGGDGTRGVGRANERC